MILEALDNDEWVYSIFKVRIFHDGGVTRPLRSERLVVMESLLEILAIVFPWIKFNAR